MAPARKATAISSNPRKCPVGSVYSSGLSEQFRVRAYALENKCIAFDSVNEYPIWFYMAITVMVPFTTQGMVLAFFGQFLAVGEHRNNIP